MRIVALVLIGSCSLLACHAQEAQLPPPASVREPVSLPAPPPEPDLRVLPINLATALQLVDAQSLDVALAGEQVTHAVAALEQARAYWLPTISLGGDYARHDGPFQDATGQIVNSSNSYFMFGAGSGIGAASVFSFNQAIFEPLVARQTVRAQKANLQAATNNTMVDVTDAYFHVEEARGNLAGAIDASSRTEELVKRVHKLAPGMVAALEITRAEAELARREEFEWTAREQWQIASAELVRLLRLDGTAQVIPVEPPQLRITLIDPKQQLDDLVALGLTHRPELAAYQAEIQAALTRVRQEKLRPLIPSLWIRGWSTQAASGSLAGGFFTGGPNSSFSSLSLRDDIDVQLLWQLDNLGFGNRAKVHLRQSELRAVNLELLRVQDRVVAEVSQAYAQARNSRHRVEAAEREVKLSLESYEKNLLGLEQTRRVGELVQIIVRPQEVLVAVQALAQSYANYYQAVAESNRAQFRLYRALGNPAQNLAASEGSAATECMPGLPDTACTSPPAVGPPGTGPD